MKECTQCGEAKPLENFFRRRRNKDGRAAQCKACAKAYASTPAARERHRVATLAWSHTQRGKETRRAYAVSDVGKVKRRKAVAKYAAANPGKLAAHRVVRLAVANGTLTQASELDCARCDQPALDYHHHSYEKQHWLDVEPLCRACHIAHHKEEKCTS